MTDRTLFDWRPEADLVVFPSIRRRGMIYRTATAAATAKNPEKTIQATLERARASHQRKRLPGNQVDRDLRDLEAAIRTQVMLLLTRRGAAG